MLKRRVAVSAGIVALSSLFATPITTFAKPHETDTTTPIKHVVVIFGENVSFDHYFGTYPRALNPAGEPRFTAAQNTPSVNNYLTHPSLLATNPNGSNPSRLDPAEAMTSDMDHGYTAEQEAFDGGKMDKFIPDTGHGNDIVMDYYDGNTVTALWNYAQHFAMSDNSYGTTFGPSSPGALNLVSGQTHGAVAYSANVTQHGTELKEGDSGYPNWALNQNGTLFSDVDPYYDSASKGTTIKMTGKNIGDLMNAKGVTWGWFEGGFRNPSATHKNIGGTSVTDYIPHHEPFQYYQSTSNPNHLPPSSPRMIGKQDQANHQYDMSDFWTAVRDGNMPAVSLLKAPAYQDAHAGYSDPLDEQPFVVDTVNRLEKTPDWKNTAVIINYDDSDGWYDHQMAPGAQVNGSNDSSTVSVDGQTVAVDELYGPGNSGKPTLGTYLDRAGYGPRLPLLVISPYAKKDFVDHTLTNQASILRFIEDNWNLGRIGDGSYDAVSNSLTNMFNFHQGPRNSKLFLNPNTGIEVARK